MSDYVYKRTERELWTVGFYDPKGKWEPESDHGYEESASERVAYLNGGNELRARAEAAEARAAQLEVERDEARRQLEQARKWARVWKLAAKWHNLSAVISFGE